MASWFRNSTRILIAAAFLQGCSGDESQINKSALKINSIDPYFVISDIVQNENGGYYFIYNDNIEGVVVDIYNIILEYDANLSFVDSTNMIGRSDLTGFRNFRRLPNHNWLVSETYTIFGDNYFHLYEMDNTFQFVNKQDVNFDLSSDPWVRDLVPMNDGTSLIAMDYNITFNSDSHVEFNKFSNDFKRIWSRPGDSLFHKTPLFKAADNSCMAPIRNNEILYAFRAIYRIADSTNIIVGKLRNDGSALYETTISPAPDLIPVNIVEYGNHVLLMAIQGSQKRPFYIEINPDDGSVVKVMKPVDGLVNGPGFELNKLSSKPGQFLYDPYEKHLQMVDFENDEAKVRFDLLLPEVNDILSCRQLATDHNTWIVACSYVFKGEVCQLIGEVDFDGKWVKRLD
ncbi:MAG: hypothetical protein GC181_08575 [Bacteroidetes bacterium]|nr:hypothetical protein [Bacteroidota bacterium]